MSTSLMDEFADEQSILDQLPSRDVEDLDHGDSIGIVYDSVHGNQPQVVRAVVIGGKGEYLYALEPREETPKSTWKRRVFQLNRDTDEIARMTAKSFSREGTDFGHRPAYEERRFEDNGGWPHARKLGDVLKCVPMDVDPTDPYGTEWGEFQLPKYPGRRGRRTFDIYESQFGGIAEAMCYRLFEAEGGRHVYEAHTFEVPEGQYLGSVNNRFLRALRWLDGKTPSDLHRRQPKVDF